LNIDKMDLAGLKNSSNTKKISILCYYTIHRAICLWPKGYFFWGL